MDNMHQHRQTVREMWHSNTSTADASESTQDDTHSGCVSIYSHYG